MHGSPLHLEDSRCLLQVGADALSSLDVRAHQDERCPGEVGLGVELCVHMADEVLRIDVHAVGRRCNGFMCSCDAECSGRLDVDGAASEALLLPNSTSSTRLCEHNGRRFACCPLSVGDDAPRPLMLLENTLVSLHGHLAAVRLEVALLSGGFVDGPQSPQEIVVGIHQAMATVNSFHEKPKA